MGSKTIGKCNQLLDFHSCWQLIATFKLLSL